ncbi:HEAT repeat domain-containing protein [Methanoregula formicica]|uniref:HEAT repeat-containing protein n=1 Tax=Methanoregula formicica (strain DSM 22288 / NBRC 105244 / SMSP) TaxID=593750 RepID=L0HI93_METFS|nr:HEAT repeat domain-containing protein [Methanoregula formicica]AGB03038.1 HEAT repeat-containing protein [Methanoregula formicica SMSP]
MLTTIDQDEFHAQLFSPKKESKEAAIGQLTACFFIFPDKVAAWNDLLLLTNDEDSAIGRRAAQALGFAYAYMPNKKKAWEDIHRICKHKEYPVRQGIVKAIRLAFVHIPDKKVAWKTLLKLVHDKNRFVREDAVRALKLTYSYFPDINVVWDEFVRLSKNKDFNIQWISVGALGDVYAHVPDKEAAWNTYLKIIYYPGSVIGSVALHTLGKFFAYIPDKESAWSTILTLSSHHESAIRALIAYNIGCVYRHVPDKAIAWNVLLNLSNDPDSDVRDKLVESLGKIYPDIPDKEAAWNILLTLANDPDYFVKMRTADALGKIFSHIPDKEAAWDTLLTLSSVPDYFVKTSTADALGKIFSHIPDKEAAWDTLLTLSCDSDSRVRERAVLALGNVYSDIPNKKRAWDTILKSTNDPDSRIQMRALHSLGMIFADIPDKEIAWNTLLTLSHDPDLNVRIGVVQTLGKIYAHAPETGVAWNTLKKFSKDKNGHVRIEALHAIRSAYPFLVNKELAKETILQLTQDIDPTVRIFAFHTAGTISIQIACDLDNDNLFRSELENAMRFFEQSYQESELLSEQEKMDKNPAQICYPLYKAFYAVTFQKKTLNETVEKFILEAQNAIIRSDAREQLIIIIEKLANALTEVEGLHIHDPTLNTRLSACSQYCSEAEALIESVENERPYAAGIMRKGAQIVRRDIDEINAEIYAQAEEICQLTRKKSPPIKELGVDIHRLVKQIKENNDVKNVTRETIQGINDKISLIPPSVLQPELGKAIKALLSIIQDSIVKEDHQQIRNSLDELKQLILKVDSHIDELEHTILARFDKTEQKIIGGIISELSKTDKQITNDIFVALEEQKLSQKDLTELKQIVKKTNEILIEIKNDVHENQQGFSDRIEQFIELQNNPADYAVKHQILVSIPILPFVSYNVTVGSPAVKLRTLWEGVKGIWKKLPKSHPENFMYNDYANSP